jgi:hypothetical protein
MATYAAIASACDAIVRLLHLAWRPELFGNAALTFSVYRTRDFASPMDSGVSLFLYRVLVNRGIRTPPSGPGTRPAALPLDLHVLLTPWAEEAAMEQEILGWMMRTLADTPLVTAELLNARLPGVFAPDEALEVVADQVSNDELRGLWDVLHTDFRVSVPYVARVVRIDSAAVGIGSPP